MRFSSGAVTTPIKDQLSSPAIISAYFCSFPCPPYIIVEPESVHHQTKVQFNYCHSSSSISRAKYILLSDSISNDCSVTPTSVYPISDQLFLTSIFSDYLFSFSPSITGFPITVHQQTKFQ